MWNELDRGLVVVDGPTLRAKRLAKRHGCGRTGRTAVSSVRPSVAAADSRQTSYPVLETGCGQSLSADQLADLVGLFR